MPVMDRKRVLYRDYNPSLDCHLAVSRLSAYYATEAATVLQWNRLSDRVGRKPIRSSRDSRLDTMLGLSRSFWSLALWYVFGKTLKYLLANVTRAATSSQPLLEWRTQWGRWRFEKCAGRTH